MANPPDSSAAPREAAHRRLTRRGVLKASAVGGGAVLAAAASGIAIRGASNGAWDQGQTEPYLLWRDGPTAPGLLKLVAAGALAANPHNIQPWSFQVGATSIDLYADPSRAMPLGDQDGRERIAGYGCAIENIVVAARSAAFDPHLVEWPDDDPAHVAHLDVDAGEPASSAESERARAITARHSNRGPYSARAVDPMTLETLAAQGPDGAEVVWVTDQAAMAEIGALYVEATQASVDDLEVSVEAFSWFRNDRQDIERHRDGLTLDCQGLDAFTLFMAKILPAQSRESGDAFWVRTTRVTHTATARAYGIIRVADIRDRHARLAGGRLVQHVHLAATVQHLGMQHMNQVSERIARDAARGQPDRFSRRWESATGVPAGQALLAFRVGYPDRVAKPSPRRPLTEIAREP
ncbi:Tat (twin-arginine translocation) pathway signal sequence [Propionibacterium cyclohexanicum]|uniref:Tat (Twin-arginine translocation) pathway signal sequence n=1 Tax=Propionibacterium cyclohexanicum TaxID=64702 RepID=A0A1H9TL59_9ACTN|nr:twin-arginine translocation signal domain-containing protein [Propionibacterium cyclohexanicum]SER97714.1 Tat (twin-arginine translocation) pathway signal sequence [Propionibacterium cyclohexanicum]